MTGVKSALIKVWRAARWPLVVLLLACMALVAWRYQVLVDQDKTNADVAAIHANKLTRDDVFGDLPPEPNKAENDATLAGIDSNQNGIRDDVERAIYFTYQASAKEAAPALQYAKALQMEFTHVYNSATLVAVLQEEDRGFACVYGREKEIEGLVFNTESRKNYREEILKKYMVSYTLPNGEDCDLSI